MSTSRRSTTATPRRTISTGSLQQTPFIKLAVTTPPTNGSLAEHIKHFTIGVLVLGISFFTCMHILMSMGIDYRSPSFLFALPHSKNFSDTALGLPMCRHQLESNGYGISALQRLSAMHGRDDVRLKHGDSIVQNVRFYYDSDDLRQPGQTTDINSSSCATVSRLIDAGVCISGTAAISVNRLRGRTSSDEITDKGVLRCLPSLVIAGTMKSGTGVLMRWLNTHPQLQSGVGEDGGNEIHFFSDNPATFSVTSQTSSGTVSNMPVSQLTPSRSISSNYTGSCDWQQYARRFPNFGLQSIRSDSRSSSSSSVAAAPILLSRARQVYTFDKSPDYIRSPEKLRRLHEMLPSARLVVLLRDPVRRAVSGFSHNCRHGRYVRLDRTLSLSLSFHPQPSRDNLNSSSIVGGVNDIPFVAINATASTGSKSKTSAAASLSSSSTSSSASTAAVFAASSSLSPLLWALLPAQFGIVPSPSSSPVRTTATSAQLPPSRNEVTGRQHHQQQQQHVRLPAGTVLQLRDLQALLALASATASDYPLPPATGQGVGYTVLRYPCSATDFHDYYFGGTTRAYTPKSANNNRPPSSIPLSGAASNNNNSNNYNSSSTLVSAMPAVSAFAAEEMAVGHYHTQLQNTYRFFPKDQVLVLFQEDLQRNVLRTLRRVENFLGLPCHDFTQGVADVEVVATTATTGVHTATVANITPVAVNITTNGNSKSSNTSIDPVDSAASLVVLVHHRHSGHGTASQVGWWLVMTTQAVMKALVNGMLGLLGDKTKEAKVSAAISSSPISLTDSFSGSSGPGGPGPGRSGSSSRHSARLQQQILGDILTLPTATAAKIKPNENQATDSPPTLRTLLVALYKDHNQRLLEYTTNLPREWIGT